MKETPEITFGSSSIEITDEQFIIVVVEVYLSLQWNLIKLEFDLVLAVM